jgi:hypothetical protein
VNPKSPLPHIPRHDQFQLEVVVEGIGWGFVIFYKIPPTKKHGKLGVYAW